MIGTKRQCIYLTNILVQVAAKKQTLKNVTDYIVNVILKRADFGYNYGVILIPEGLIDFIPEVLFLIFDYRPIVISSFLFFGLCTFENQNYYHFMHT